jgi:Tfp pilus assembly PilM family ATPase
VDIGAEGTNVVVSGPECLWFRYIGIGGAHLSKALVKELNLTLVQAEEIKRNTARARRLSEIDRAVSPVLADLTREIKSCFAQFHRANEGRSIRRVLCMGGGALFHGLIRHLRTGR